MVAIVLVVLAVIGMVVAMVVMDIEEARSKEKMLVEVNTSEDTRGNRTRVIRGSSAC